MEKINPIGGEPEVCSFRFSGLAGPGGTMDGDIRYLPGTNALRVVFVAINSIEFSSRDTTNAAVDRPNNEVDFTGKVLPASTNVAVDHHPERQHADAGQSTRRLLKAVRRPARAGRGICRLRGSCSTLFRRCSFFRGLLGVDPSPLAAGGPAAHGGL